MLAGSSGCAQRVKVLSLESRWALSAVNCGAGELPVTQPIKVSVVSGAGTTCTLTNTFEPLGSITLAKVTKCALGTTGFVITPTFGQPGEIHQSAKTSEEGVAATEPNNTHVA